MNQDEIMLDIARRHSQLHQVDDQCVKAMKALLAMQKTCYASGLTDEVNAVHAALVALHAKAKALWEEGK